MSRRGRLSRRAKGILRRELKPRKTGEKGLVKQPRDRIAAIRRVLSAAADCGLRCLALAPSPIRGGDGNEEYLALFDRCVNAAQNFKMPIEKTVMEGKVCP